MMTKSPLLLLGLLAGMAFSAAAGEMESHEFFYDFLSGNYLAVGRDLDSAHPYSGRVIFEGRPDRLLVTRLIGEETIRGVGRIEHTCGPDQADVLRVRFQHGDENFEITYLWHSDLNNYARLSGYLYRPNERTDRPGLEALFPDPATEPDMTNPR
ncbi:MAG: hypothetical protein P8X63_01895 [Desulfuromonadaceae bacterium]|jgi:hypothetical protein